jgi:hypothetical protein
MKSFTYTFKQINKIMSDKLDKIEAARKEINYKRRAKPELGGRFELDRAKKSQSDNAISNVKVIRDLNSGATYTISITAMAVATDKEVTDAVYDDELLELQKHFTKFLETVHELL